MRAQKPTPRLRPFLRLFVAGITGSGARALENRQRLLEALQGQAEIEIVDILERPAEAETAAILATPTLSDESVDPPRRLVGDLSDIDNVLRFFGYLREGTAL